jgi:hypothetical protein
LGRRLRLLLRSSASATSATVLLLRRLGRRPLGRRRLVWRRLGWWRLVICGSSAGCRRISSWPIFFASFEAVLPQVSFQADLRFFQARHDDMTGLGYGRHFRAVQGFRCREQIGCESA